MPNQGLQPLCEIGLRGQVPHGIDDHIDQRVGSKIKQPGARIGDFSALYGSLCLHIGNAGPVWVRKAIADSGDTVGFPQKFAHAAVERGIVISTLVCQRDNIQKAYNGIFLRKGVRFRKFPLKGAADIVPGQPGSAVGAVLGDADKMLSFLHDIQRPFLICRQRIAVYKIGKGCFQNGLLADENGWIPLYGFFNQAGQKFRKRKVSLGKGAFSAEIDTADIGTVGVEQIHAEVISALQFQEKCAFSFCPKVKFRQICTNLLRLQSAVRLCDVVKGGIQNADGAVEQRLAARDDLLQIRRVQKNVK